MARGTTLIRGGPTTRRAGSPAGAAASAARSPGTCAYPRRGNGRRARPRLPSRATGETGWVTAQERSSGRPRHLVAPPRGSLRAKGNRTVSFTAVTGSMAADRRAVNNHVIARGRSRAVHLHVCWWQMFACSEIVCIRLPMHMAARCAIRPYTRRNLDGCPQEQGH